MRRDGKALGALIVYRDRLAPFTDDELALQQSFADQAVIAIENARLFNETQQALSRQEATAEILRTVASTPGNADQSLRQIAETSARLFGAPSVTLLLAENGEWTKAYRFGASSERIGSALPLQMSPVGGSNLPGRVVADDSQIHVPDLDNLPPEMTDWPGLPHARAGGTRTACGTPLRREGKAIGALLVFRDRLAPFTEQELALQQSFADQAVIAIENARLFNETQEALARQTATSDILRVISSSPTDVQPVFDEIVLTAARLLRCDRAFIQRHDGQFFWTVAAAGQEGPLPITVFKRTPIDPDANFPSRAIARQANGALAGWSAIELPEFERGIRELAASTGHSTSAARDGECIGLLSRAVSSQGQRTSWGRAANRAGPILLRRRRR